MGYAAIEVSDASDAEIVNCGFLSRYSRALANDFSQRPDVHEGWTLGPADRFPGVGLHGRARYAQQSECRRSAASGVPRRLHRAGEPSLLPEPRQLSGRDCACQGTRTYAKRETSRWLTRFRFWPGVFSERTPRNRRDGEGQQTFREHEQVGLLYLWTSGPA